MKRPLAILLLVVMVLPQTARAGQLAARPADAVGGGQAEQLDLLVGRSTVVRMDRPITRVSLSTPDIADVLVTTPYEFLVHGKMPGTISLLVWGDGGRIKSYDIAVKRDLSSLEAQIRRLFPGEAITATSNGKDVVLAGLVSSKYIVDRASSLAVGYVEKPENVVNLLRQQEGQTTNQILLRVRFAEVSRSAMQELGVSFFTGPAGKNNWIGRTETQQFPGPDFDQDKGLVFSDFLNLFLFNTEEQLGAVVRALKGKGLFQSLAEPNLITQDGKEATFLAGGEFPYPVVQGTGANSAVTIVFKEFGVRLRFTPTVLADDSIQLRVAPEVSSLDFGNGVTLQGFRVPSLATRRTETSVELRDGQTFAIAGMLDQNVNETLRRIPGHRRYPDSRLSVPQPGLYEERDRAGRDDHAAHRAPQLAWCHAEPALTGRAVPGRSGSPPYSAAAGIHGSGGATAARAGSTRDERLGRRAGTAGGRHRQIDRPGLACTAGAERARCAGRSGGSRGCTGRRIAEARCTDESRASGGRACRARRQTTRPTPQSVQARKDAEQARKDEAKRLQQEKAQAEIDAREAHLQAERDGERARLAAKEENERLAKERKELERAQKADAERQEIERKAAEKLAAEQAVKAARIKEMADKLEKEKMDRDAELQRLVTQYQKLTEGQPSSSAR